MEEQRRENKMGVQPVGKLLISMSLPVMVSMLVQALYNIVDSIFVAQLSENALRAVSLAFPVQNLIIAVGVGTGVGINSLVSRRLGERRFEEANKAAENGVFLGVCSWLVFAVLGLLFQHALRCSGARRACLWAVVLSAAYAATDELHQYFIPLRTASLMDVLIDTLSASLACALDSLRLRRKAKKAA